MAMSEQRELMATGDERTLRTTTDLEKNRPASDSDVEGGRGFRLTSQRPLALLVPLALGATALVAWGLSADADGHGGFPGGGQSAVGPVRKLLQSDELTEMVIVQARNADLDSQTISQADLRSGVRALMDEFGGLVDDHLDIGSRQALDAAQIDPTFFTTLRRMFYTFRKDPRVAQIGRDTLAVIMNTSATSQDINRLFRGNFGMNATEFDQFQAEVIPQELAAALRARASTGRGIDLGFSPAAIDHLRHPEQSREKVEFDTRVRKLLPPHQRLQGAVSRRLMGTTAELTVSIVTVSCALLVEILVQLQCWILPFNFPVWIWSLMAIPYVGVGSWTCGFASVYGNGAKSVFCDVFLGSVAVNSIEYLVHDIVKGTLM